MATFTDTLPSGNRLLKGQDVVSTGGRYQLTLQGDSHLVLYDGTIGTGFGDPNAAIWHQNDGGTAADFCEMQADGNFVLYGFGGAVIWASDTADHPGSYLVVQGDGNLVIYQPIFPIWDRHGRRGGFI